MRELAKRPYALLAAAVALLQTVALLYGVYGRDQLLKNGREIVVPVVPLDPRDFFRGDYVTLGYPMSQITSVDGAPIEALEPGVVPNKPVYVTLSPQPEGSWRVTQLSAAMPTTASQGGIVIRGRVRSIINLPSSTPGATGQQVKTVNVVYGIERYFVPEGTGMAIEQQVRSDGVKAVLAVASDGQAVIKGLIVDGVRRDVDPVF